MINFTLQIIEKKLNNISFFYIIENNCALKNIKVGSFIFLFNKQGEFAGWLFDKVAGVCYDLLDYLEQYERYIDNLKIVDVSLSQDFIEKNLSNFSNGTVDSIPAYGKVFQTVDIPFFNHFDHPKFFLIWQKIPGELHFVDINTFKRLEKKTIKQLMFKSISFLVFQQGEATEQKPAACDLRYYDKLMSNVPVQSESVPLILDCLLEQVSSILIILMIKLLISLSSLLTRFA